MILYLYAVFLEFSVDFKKLSDFFYYLTFQSHLSWLLEKPTVKSYSIQHLLLSLYSKSNTSWIDSHGTTQTCSSYEKCGKGKFMPFDFTGIVNGAAKCFYAYIGFDAIASTGEEVVNPKRNIPLSILITLGIVSTLYCFLSGVLTLMIPYYIIDAGIT